MWSTSKQRFINTRNEPGTPVVVMFNKVTNSTTLASGATKGTRTITVTSSTGIAVGSYLILFNATDGHFGFYKVTSIAGAPVITVDSELEYSFAAGTDVDVATVALNVDGSSTSQVFGIRGDTSGEPVDVCVCINKIVAVCVVTTKPDYSDFGDITALTNGVLLRKRNGDTQNIGAAKTNIELASQAGRWQLLESSISGYGFIADFEFAGENNLNTPIIIKPGDDLEIVIQDDLTGLISFSCVAFGRVKAD